MITQAPRGTKDWFGKDMDQRTYLENIFKDLCASYNIHEIITPVFEHTELFQRGVGETTDVVQKEMYTFESRVRFRLTYSIKVLSALAYIVISTNNRAGADRRISSKASYTLFT